MKSIFILCTLLMTNKAFAATGPEEALTSIQNSSSSHASSYVIEHANDPNYLNISDIKLSEFLNDPSKRITGIFSVPKEIRNDVFFWFKIYTKYSIYQTLVYDKEHPEVVYDVIDVWDLFKKGKSASNIEVTMKLRLTKSLASIKGAIKNIIKNPKKEFSATSLESAMKKTWGNLPVKDWRQILANVRTQPGQRDKVILGISRAEPFMPAMETIFKRQKLPTELVRIPILESSFNLTATSKASAKGVWQFLEKSASEYLIVNKHVNIDERLSPIKSTYAAAKLFQRNYRMLGDYGLAIIAYNHGHKNLVKARDKYQGAGIAELLKPSKHSFLGYASRSYYCEFLAILYAEQYRDSLFGMKLQSTTDSSAISIVKIKKPSSIFDIAANYNISLHELRLYNPDIFDLKKQLPAGTRVVVPKALSESLVNAPFFNFNGDKRAPANTSRVQEFEFIEYLQ